SLEPPQSRAPTETVAGRDGRNSGVASDGTAGTNPNATLATVTSPITRGRERTFRPAIIARLPTLRRAGSTAPLPPTRAHHDSIRIQIVCANRIAASRELARDFSVWGVPYRLRGHAHGHVCRIFLDQFSVVEAIARCYAFYGDVARSR